MPTGQRSWWLAVVLGLAVPGFSDAMLRSVPGVSVLVLACVIVTRIVLAISLEWRDRRREGRRIAG